MKRFIGRKEYFGALFYDRARAIVLEPIDRKGALILEALSRHSLDEIIQAFEDILTGEQIRAFLEEWKTAGLLDDSFRLQSDIMPEAGEKGVLSAPLRIYFSITDVCNLRCTHCSADATGEGARGLSLEEISKLFRQMASIGVFQVNITGGEPFSRPDLPEILEEGVRQGLTVSLTTNGTLVTEKIASRIAHIPLHYIAMSLDGAGPETHEYVRGKGSFARVLRALDILKKETHHEISLQFTVMKHNRRELGAFFDLVASSTADMASVTILRPAGRALQNRPLWISQEEFVSVVKEANALAEAYPKPVVLPRTLSPHYPRRIYEGLGCSAANLTCNISATGFLLPCNYFEGRKWLGESLRERTIQQIWLEGESFKNLRALSGNAKCEACPDFDNCRGYCRASAWNTTGDINAPDYLCLHRDSEGAAT